MQHTISILVDNKPGVLTRVTGLVARRGFNIESLAVDTTEDPRLSRVTLVMEADEVSIEQINKQLHKLINVHKIIDLTGADAIERELALFKVVAAPDKRNEIVEVASLFRANIVDVSQNALVVEATGTHDKLQALEDLLRPYGIKEIVRTGKIALSRGAKE
ncbi:MAG: acetolactate synthase small subunit [Coriobacteriaceae bacterium]|nr:acetolactate synthase small subunit [Coriobacteriaceae bacterium]